eukprot:scaffold4600_cov245-Pinguiococcus_pyrenoidosus.AAC.2
MVSAMCVSTSASGVRIRLARLFFFDGRMTLAKCAAQHDSLRILAPSAYAPDRCPHRRPPLPERRASPRRPPSARARLQSAEPPRLARALGTETHLPGPARPGAAAS